MPTAYFELTTDGFPTPLSHSTLTTPPRRLIIRWRGTILPVACSAAVGKPESALRKRRGVWAATWTWRALDMCFGTR